MQVHCTDGTVFDCEGYDVNDYGLVVYGQEPEKDQDRYDDDEPEKIAFVPHDRLWYVLPKGVQAQSVPTPQQQPNGQQRSTAPGGSTVQQQQKTQQQPNAGGQPAVQQQQSTGRTHAPGPRTPE